MTKEELEKLEECLQEGEVLQHAFDLPDGNNSHAKMVIWNHPGDDYTGFIGRMERIVDTSEAVSSLSSFVWISCAKGRIYSGAKGDIAQIKN